LELISSALTNRADNNQSLMCYFTADTSSKKKINCKSFTDVCSSWPELLGYCLSDY